MGTQTTPGGPKDKPGLLPKWAEPSEPDGPDKGPEPAQPVPVVPPRHWQSARRSMTKLVSGSGNGRAMRGAARGYVGARGGSKKAAASARAGKASTAAVGSFLGTVTSHGVSEALRDLGLRDVVGQSVEAVCAEISNRLAPAGRSKEDVAARRALNDVLAHLYEQYILGVGDISGLERMDEAAIDAALELSVASYIYYRWLDDLGKSIEDGAISEANAIKLERQIKDYVRECVSLALKEENLAGINWESGAGREVVERIYRQAYAILEVAR